MKKIILFFTVFCLQAAPALMQAQAPGNTPYTVELWLKADEVQNTLPSNNASVYIWKDRSDKELDFVRKGSLAVPTFKKVSDFNYQPSLVWANNGGQGRELTLISQSNFTSSTSKSYYIFTVSKVEDGTREYAQPIIQLQPANNTLNNSLPDGTALAWTGSSTSTSGDNVYRNTYRAVTTTLDGTAHVTGNASAGFDTQAGDKKYGLISWIIPNNTNASSGDIAAVYLNGHKSNFWDGSATGSGWIDRRGRGSSWKTGAANKIQLGQGSTSSSFPFQGEIMEVIILSQNGNAAIDPEKLQQMETYLALKYGLTLNLASGDATRYDKYINSSGRAVWTYDTAFNQKIFGIGRDNASGLYQKQAKSYEGSAFTAFVGKEVADLNVENISGTLNNMDYVVFGAAIPGKSIEYGGANGYPKGTLFNGVALNEPKGINYRKNAIYKAMPTKNGIVTAMKVQLQVPVLTQYVLVSRNINFDPDSTRLYAVKNGVVAIEVDANFKYIDFAGYRSTATSGPGGVKRDIRLWLRADQTTTLDFVSQTNAGRGGTGISGNGQPDLASSEIAGMLRESSVDSWTSVVPGAGANGTYFPKYEYIGSQNFSNRPGWNAIVPDLNYNPGVTFHRRGEGKGSNSVAAEYLIKNSNTDTTKIFDKGTPDRATLIVAMIPEIDPVDDATYILGFGKGNEPGYSSPGVMDPLLGVNSQPNGIRSFRYAEYGMAHNSQAANGDGVVGVENMFDPNSTLIMSYYMRYNYDTAGNDTLIFGVDGKYEVSHVGRDGTGNANDNYDKGRGARATFNQYASIGAAGYRGRALKGNIGEIIFYEGQLTKDETERINSYLALKYGITLKVADYGGKFSYKLSDGTVIWNGQNGIPEKDYHNNVAAVGRDDNADFYNRQAHSTGLNSLLHVGIAGSMLSKDGKSNLGDFSNDKEAVVWGNNGAMGFRDVPQDDCYKFTKMLKRTWAMKKTSAGNRAIPLIVAVQDNRGSGSSKEMLDIYNMLIPQNELFMLIADSPADMDANNFKMAVPMEFLNGEFQCSYNFTNEITYITFACKQNAYPCANRTDKEFEGMKTLDWTQWTRNNNNLNGQGVKTLTQPVQDLGDGITATTTITYDNQVRTGNNYPRFVTNPRGGIAIDRFGGAVNTSKVTVTIEFNSAVYPEFFVSGLDERRDQKDQVTITGKCGDDKDDIRPTLAYANARTTRFIINGKRATVNQSGRASASDASGKLNVVFDVPVKKIEIEYVITGRVYGTSSQQIFISPLSLRSSRMPLPAPIINEDGLAFTKGVKQQKITACEDVEYSFYLTNTNFTEKYVSFKDVLPAGLTWKDESLGLDTVNAKNLLDNRYLKIGNYARTNTLTLDSLVIPCTSTICITATAVPVNNLLSPGDNRDFFNYAQIDYDRLSNNGQDMEYCTLKSSDRETLDSLTVVNIEYTQARSQLILAPSICSNSAYSIDEEIVVTLAVDNRNSEPIYEMYLDLNFDAGFTFKDAAGVTVTNPNDTTDATLVTTAPTDFYRTIAGSADGLSGFMLPTGITTFQFTLIAPSQADLVHQLNENGQGTVMIAPLNVQYGYSSTDMDDVCFAKVMDELTGQIEVPYFRVAIRKVIPAIGPNTGGSYIGSSASGNPYGIDANKPVIVKGQGFKSESFIDIEFGGVKSTNVTVVNDSTITCVPPPVTSSTVWSSSYNTVWNEGVVDLVILQEDIPADLPLTNAYTYRAPMTITGVSPDDGPVSGNTQITITGYNFLPPALFDTGTSRPFKVFFDTNPVDTISVTNERIVVKTQKHQVNHVDITTDNLIEKYVTDTKPFTFYPTVFIEAGNWDEYDKWEDHSSENILPYAHSVIQIKANCVQNMDVDMDSITVHPGVAYTVDSGQTLQANVFTLLDNASFLNNGTDNITEARAVHELKKGRNWYVSSPMQGGNVKPTVDPSLSKDAQGNPLSSWRVEYYNEPNFNVWHPAAGSFETGRGYTAYSENEDIAACFTGRFTDGDQTAPALSRTGHDHPKRGFNLVGNPFPSYWQWTDTAARAAHTYSTIWYRTKNKEYEFWSYNASGNVAAAPGWEDEIPNASLAYIPPMQAFWVRLKDGKMSGTLTFHNNDRSHADNSNNILKIKGQENRDMRPLLRLTVTGNASTDEAVIYADPAAQYGFDTYDSDKMFTGNGAEIFTIPLARAGQGGSFEYRELVINGLPAIEEGMEIPLGFQSGASGIFSINAKEIQNLDAMDVFLRDRLRRVEFNLRNGDEYNFSAGSTPVTDRFSIAFRRSSSTGLDNMEAYENFLAYADKEGRIGVSLHGRNMQSGNISVAVFDIAGRKLMEQAVPSGENILLNGIFNNGVYVVRAGNRTAKVVVEKE